MLYEKKKTYVENQTLNDFLKEEQKKCNQYKISEKSDGNLRPSGPFSANNRHSIETET